MVDRPVLIPRIESLKQQLAVAEVGGQSSLNEPGQITVSSKEVALMRALFKSPHSKENIYIVYWGID